MPHDAISVPPVAKAAGFSIPLSDYGHTLMALAEALTELGETEAAVQVWLRVTASHSYPRAKVQLAELYLAKHQPAQARSELKDVVADDAHAPAFQRRRERVWVRRAKSRLRQIPQPIPPGGEVKHKENVFTPAGHGYDKTGDFAGSTGAAPGDGRTPAAERGRSRARTGVEEKHSNNGSEFRALRLTELRSGGKRRASAYPGLVLKSPSAAAGTPARAERGTHQMLGWEPGRH